MTQRRLLPSFQRISGALLLATLAVTSGRALADDKPFSLSASPSKDGGSKGGYRAFVASLPIANVGQGLTGRVELNIFGRASLAIEGSYQSKKQDLTSKEQKTSGDSILKQSHAVAAFLARYSEPMQMAGFYYGLGLGYRQETAQWKRKPDGTIGSAALDQSTYANHSADISGPTGHLRGGYRYVGKDIPLLVGAYFGIRHFEAVVKDDKSNGQNVGGVTYTDMTDAEKDHLKRRFATSPEVGIEIGFAI